MVRADIFTGSLAVWKECGEAAVTACLPRPPAAGEGKNSFELYSEYTASWENASLQRLPRGGKAAARLVFERDFLVKKKRIYQ